MWNHIDLSLCALGVGNYLPLLTQLAERPKSNNDTRIVSETTLTYHLAVLIDNFNSLNAKFTLQINSMVSVWWQLWRLMR